MIRLAIGNARTTEDDIRRSWEVLLQMRAVIFDLWETLIDWDRGSGRGARRRGRGDRRRGFGERWSRCDDRYNAPIRTALAEAGVPADGA